MQRPHPSQEVDCFSLIPGLLYWSLPLPHHANSLDEMRGTFVGYYTNSVGIEMVRFRPAYIRTHTGHMREYGRFEIAEPTAVGNQEAFNPNGFVSRVWRPPIQQMRKYYKIARFTPAELTELRRRVKARERREAQRGLMGSFPEGRVMGSWPREKLPAVVLGLIAKCL